MSIHGMHKLLVLLLVNGVLLTLGASGAIANRSIGISEGGRVTGTGSSVTMSQEGSQIICSFTLTQTLRATFPKTREGVVGGGTENRMSGCTSTIPFSRVAPPVILSVGTALYTTFIGTLPNISQVLFLVSGYEILIAVEAVGQLLECLYRGTVGLIYEGGPNNVNRYTFQLPNQLNLHRALDETLALCRATMPVNGSVNLSRVYRFTLL